jgi:glycosyltransferase involved in cell wall biosynthesis
MRLVRRVLRALGKGDRKLIAVFAGTAEEAAAAVAHVRRGAPDWPVWVLCPEPVPAGLADCVLRYASLGRAIRALWPYWVALGVTAWTGKPGGWGYKFAPFFLHPLRVLVMNERRDFFAATPSAIGRHAARRLRDRIHSAAVRAGEIHRGGWLWLFALVAQRFAPLSRWLFRRACLQAGAALPAEAALPAPTAHSGVCIVRHARRHWSKDEVRRALGRADIRWVLFLEECAAPDVSSWLGLFEDPRTFAVSLQMDCQDWKPGLFATAPFRTLQPGEVSRTLAPVSSAILADRAKLQALGLPDTIVPGTAWLLWFWRAAAAGWPAYSIGMRPGPLPDAPDWPYEEAEFVTRVLSHAGWRALRPREPALARGSIAFHPAYALPFRGLPRVLVVSPYLPFPLSHGGAVRIYNLCRSLHDRVDFVLACFREKSDWVDYPKLHEVFRRVFVVDRDEKPSGAREWPRQVREHPSQPLRALIAELCRSQAISLVQIEYTHLAGFRSAAPDVPALLVEHDVTFTLYRQYAQQTGAAEARTEAGRWFAFEAAALRSFDAVWTMSEEDRARAIEAGSRPESTAVVANGVDLDRFAPLPDAPEPEIFYIGSFRHLPNIIGFETLRDEVMPRVWRRMPGARLRVVAGPDPERFWRQFRREPMPQNRDPRIELHEFVEDVRPLYARAQAVAVPLAVSAGTNVKVLEAMACGRAVVSTPVGCQGLGLTDGHDILIRAPGEAFAEGLLALLEDAALRQRIAAEARRTVEARFGWDAIAARAWRSYQQVIRR